MLYKNIKPTRSSNNNNLTYISSSKMFVLYIYKMYWLYNIHMGEYHIGTYYFSEIQTFSLNKKYFGKLSILLTFLF